MTSLNPNITDSDIATVRQVRNILVSILSMPKGALEHAVQLAHESTTLQRNDPEDIFEAQGVTRKALRMYWLFRCNLEAVMPREAAR